MRQEIPLVRREEAGDVGRRGWPAGSSASRGGREDVEVVAMRRAARLPHLLFNPPVDGSPAALLLRLMAGGVFVSGGILKFAYPATLGVGRFTKLGFPAPGATAAFVGTMVRVLPHASTRVRAPQVAPISSQRSSSLLPQSDADGSRHAVDRASAIAQAQSIQQRKEVMPRHRHQ